MTGPCHLMNEITLNLSSYEIHKNKFKKKTTKLLKNNSDVLNVTQTFIDHKSRNNQEE